MKQILVRISETINAFLYEKAETLSAAPSSIPLGAVVRLLPSESAAMLSLPEENYSYFRNKLLRQLQDDTHTTAPPPPDPARQSFPSWCNLNGQWL